MTIGLNQQVDANVKALAGTLQLREKEVAKIFSWNLNHVPYEEREDMLQSLSLKVLETTPNNSRTLMTICYNYVADWWRKYSANKHNVSLEDTIMTPAGEERQWRKTIVNTISSEIAHDAVIGHSAAVTLWEQLPENIQEVVAKRLKGEALNDVERKRLNRYIHEHPALLEEYS